MASKEVTGYTLREALKRWRIRRDVADKQFKDSLWAFASDEGQKVSSEQISKNYAEADYNLAKLQEIQQEFNRTVAIDVQGRKMTLALAIKLVGGVGRRESMWRNAATDTGRDRRYYGGREMSRSTDEEHAKRTVPQD